MNLQVIHALRRTVEKIHQINLDKSLSCSKSSSEKIETFSDPHIYPSAGSSSCSISHLENNQLGCSPISHHGNNQLGDEICAQKNTEDYVNTAENRKAS